MTLILGRQEVEKLLTMQVALQAVEQAFVEHGSGRTEIPQRTVLALEAYEGFMGFMPAYMEGLGAAGVKVINHHRHNRRKHGLPESAGLIIYHDPATGMPLAIMDCAYITRMRTGAATGVSVKYLARQDVDVVGIIGTGAQAAPQIAAVCGVRAPRKVKAYGTNSQATARFLEQVRPLNLEVEVVDGPQEACTDVDVLVTCTPATEAVVRAEWLRAGVHVAAVGADMPYKRELAPDVYARADRWVVDLMNQALLTGEMADAIAANVIVEGAPHTTLDEVVTGRKPGRERDDEITLFKSTGMAIQDVATAKWVYDVAKEQSVGLEVDITP